MPSIDHYPYYHTSIDPAAPSLVTDYYVPAAYMPRFVADDDGDIEMGDDTYDSNYCKNFKGGTVNHQDPADDATTSGVAATEAPVPAPIAAVATAASWHPQSPPSTPVEPVKKLKQVKGKSKDKAKAKSSSSSVGSPPHAFINNTSPSHPSPSKKPRGGTKEHELSNGKGSEDRHSTTLASTSSTNKRRETCYPAQGILWWAPSPAPGPTHASAAVSLERGEVEEGPRRSPPSSYRYKPYRITAPKKSGDVSQGTSKTSSQSPSHTASSPQEVARDATEEAEVAEFRRSTAPSPEPSPLAENWYSQCMRWVRKFDPRTRTSPAVEIPERPEGSILKRRTEPFPLLDLHTFDHRSYVRDELDFQVDGKPFLRTFYPNTPYQRHFVVVPAKRPHKRPPLPARERTIRFSEDTKTESTTDFRDYENDENNNDFKEAASTFAEYTEKLPYLFNHREYLKMRGEADLAVYAAASAKYRGRPLVRTTNAFRNEEELQVIALREAKEQRARLRIIANIERFLPNIALQQRRANANVVTRATRYVLGAFGRRYTPYW